MPETLFTVEEAAHILKIHPQTVRTQLRNGDLRGIRRGRFWRVLSSALYESSPTESIQQNAADTPKARAAQILADIRSGDIRRRNAAISRLARGDAKTRALVENETNQVNALYEGQGEDFAAWRALDGAPVFPDEAPDYLDGLYRTDETAQDDIDQKEKT